MTTINELKASTTELEFEMLSKIVGYYTFDDNICYAESLTASEKGIVGSLVKKRLVYDSFISETAKGYKSNFFPADEVLDVYGLEHY
jgi:hypothetical protein